MKIRHCDTIVVGAGLGGITTAHVLTQLGHTVTLLEKSASLGGISGSYKNSLGFWFDYGMHVLDEDRHPLVTSLFKNTLKNGFERTLLRRGIVLEGAVIDYNAPVTNWPTKFQDLFPKNELVDDLSENPTREEVSEIYGKAFADHIFDKVLISYPTLAWQKDRGVPEHKLMNLIHPWFFPQAKKTNFSTDPGSKFHEQTRTGKNQYILYPSKNGFGEFLNEMVAQLPKDKVEIRKDLKILNFKTKKETKSIEAIELENVRLESAHIYWCAPIAILCKEFGVELPYAEPQEFLMGNFTFDKNIKTPYQEIILGDPDHLIKRIHFPGKFSKQPDTIAQVEFMVQKGAFNHTDKEWGDRWLKSLKDLKLISKETKVLDFQYKAIPRGFVTTTPYSEFVELFKKNLTNPKSNVHFPFWGLGPENINRIVPSIFETVPKSLGVKGAPNLCQNIPTKTISI